MFRDFKGFAKAKLDLFRPLTILIGPNGSGKSNVIEGLELLSFVSHGRPLHEIVDSGHGTNGTLEIRGGLESCPRHGKDRFTLGFTAAVPFDGLETRLFEYWVTVKASPEPRIVDEELRFPHEDTTIFRTRESDSSGASADIAVEYNNFARGGRKPIARVSAGRSVLSQYTQFAGKNNKKLDACIRVVKALMRHLRSSFVFDPVPRLMRNYERVANREMLRTGANLSAVLFGLSQGAQKEKEALYKLLEWVRQLPEEPYRDFDFVKTPLNDVIFGLKEGEDGQFVDARLLSDGTLRALAVLAALQTVKSGSRVVIEEFDNGLHPSRLKVLAEALEESCKDRDLNVLVTTHNPATLDALKPSQLKGVVMCVWDDEAKAFDLIRLADLPQYPELLERGRLGDLVTRRVIEQYLAPKFDEQRKQEALQWLEGLA